MPHVWGASVHFRGLEPPNPCLVTSLLYYVLFSSVVFECAANELSKLTKNYRLGLGTFVDKTILPYVNYKIR